MLYEAFLDEEMKTAQDFKDKKRDEKRDRTDERRHIIHREFNKQFAGDKFVGDAKQKDLPKHDIKSYDKAREYVIKTRDDGDGNLGRVPDFTAASDAVERHDRRHPDRKIAESFDVSVFE